MHVRKDVVAILVLLVLLVLLVGVAPSRANAQASTTFYRVAGHDFGASEQLSLTVVPFDMEVAERFDEPEVLVAKIYESTKEPVCQSFETHEYQASGGYVTDAQLEAARQIYERRRAESAGKAHEVVAFDLSLYDVDTGDFSSLPPETLDALLRQDRLRLLLSLPEGEWTNDEIHETARLILEQAETVARANGIEASMPEIDIFFTFHDPSEGTGDIRWDSVEISHANFNGPDSENPHPIHKLKKNLGIDIAAQVNKISNPNDDGFRFFGHTGTNSLMPENPGPEKSPDGLMVLWSNAIKPSALDSFSKNVVQHELVHIEGGLECPHIDPPVSTMLMNASTPFGDQLNDGECIARVELNSNAIVLNWPSQDPSINVASEATGEIPEAFSGQSYPNPFSASTTIPYTLSRRGQVRLVVVDLLGREVAVLVDAVRLAGQHTAPFNAAHLPSGLYVYRLETEQGFTARKMILAK